MNNEETGRFDAIETQLAHQEMLLAQLNEAVTNQQASITKLEAHCESILAKIRSISELMPGDPPEEERPPHY